MVLAPLPERNRWFYVPQRLVEMLLGVLWKCFLELWSRLGGSFAAFGVPMGSQGSFGVFA